jgi:hypothetical protein
MASRYGTAAVNVLNEQWRSANRGGPPASGLGEGLK